MDFLEVKVFCEDSFKDILIAEFGGLGFDSMIETDAGFSAYHQNPNFELSQINDLKSKYSTITEITFQTRLVPKENWNQIWEKNYEPVVVNQGLSIRASFHAPLDTTSEIIIDPKMSFGTGHHQTTLLMARQMLGMDFRDKKVLDAGCGTGILAILAAKVGAKTVHGFDIDEWAVENSLENAQKNGADEIAFWQGDISSVINTDYDVILANINKNVLLKDIPQYMKILKSPGEILLSGFYNSDILQIKGKFQGSTAILTEEDEEEEWVGLKFDLP